MPFLQEDYLDYTRRKIKSCKTQRCEQDKAREAFRRERTWRTRARKTQRNEVLRSIYAF